MVFLRFIIVLFTFLCFATTSFANGMMCCKESAVPQKVAAAEQGHTPCHPAPQQHDETPKKTTVKSCQCACAQQLVTLPEVPGAAENIAALKPDTVLVQMPLGLSPAIDTPPKIAS